MPQAASGGARRPVQGAGTDEKAGVEEGGPDSPAPPGIGKNGTRVLIIREKKACLSYRQVGLSMWD